MIDGLPLLFAFLALVGGGAFLLHWLDVRLPPDSDSAPCPNCRARLQIPYGTRLVRHPVTRIYEPDDECHFCGALLDFEVVDDE